MDNDYPVDVPEILSVVRQAEVIVMRFLIVPQRLLFDSRSDANHGPLLKLVPPANSAEERFRSLRRLRPDFPAPERITVIHWPKMIGLLDSLGVWDAIRRRALDAGFSDTPGLLDGIWNELTKLEADEKRKAVSGEGYQTLWERM